MAALGGLVALALVLRLQGLPGAWGADALYYAETALGDRVPDFADRSHRVLFIALVKLGLWAGGSPVGASVPGVLLSVAVLPALWFAGRRRLGDRAALLPPLLWTFLGLDLEEVVELSADAAIALPCAVGLALLVGARDRPQGRMRWLVGAGVALGLAAAVKETAVFALAGCSLGALCLDTGLRRLRNAVVLGGCGAALFLALSFALTPDRLTVVSANMARVEGAVRWGEVDFGWRLLTGPLPSLLTATGAWGLLTPALLPLLARLPLRALRGDLLAVTALGGLAAFWFLPVSLRTWAVLPATYPRYLLCLTPALLLACAEALRDAPTSRLERAVSGLAACAGLVFLRPDRTVWLFLLPALAATSWPALPERLRALWRPGWHYAVASAMLVTAEVTLWETRPPGLALLLGVIPVLALVAPLSRRPWLTGRTLPGEAVAAAMCVAIVATVLRFRPDPVWDLWDHLPAAKWQDPDAPGEVYADREIARWLRIARPDLADRVRSIDGGRLDGVWDDVGLTDRVLTFEPQIELLPAPVPNAWRGTVIETPHGTLNVYELSEL